MCICTTPSCSGLRPLHWVLTTASTFCLAPCCRCFCHIFPILHTMTSESWILFLFFLHLWMQVDIWLGTTQDRIHGHTALWCLQSDTLTHTSSFPSSLCLPPSASVTITLPISLSTYIDVCLGYFTFKFLKVKGAPGITRNEMILTVLKHMLGSSSCTHALKSWRLIYTDMFQNSQEITTFNLAFKLPIDFGKQ
jgi:hypothetical protein